MPDHTEVFQKIKQIASTGHVELFILKTTTSIKPEKMRELLRVTVEGGIVNYFKDLVKQKIDWLNNDSELSFIDFFEDTARDRYICTLSNTDDIPVLSHILARIQQDSHEEPISVFSEKDLDKLQSYAIEFKRGEERVIYFRKYGKGSKISSTGFALIFKRGMFNKLDGDVFKIDQTIDCIYYEWGDQKGVYILNRENFESIFSFYEIYKAESQTAHGLLVASNLVSITQGLFESIINTRRYSKKIALINKRGNFRNIDLEKIQQLISRSQEHLRFDIQEGKVVIQNKEGLADFLDVCEKNILQDPFDSYQLYRTKNKERLQ